MASARQATPASRGNAEVTWTRLRNFMRGYATKAVLPGEALQFVNVMVDREFKVVPRPALISSTADLVASVCQGIKTGGIPNKTLFVYGGLISHASGSPPWTPVLLETCTGTLNLAQILIWGNYLVVIGVTDAYGGVPRKYDGTTSVALGGSPPTALHGAVWIDRLWLSNGAGGGGRPVNRLYYSEAANIETWPALNWMDVGDGAFPIQAIAPSGDSLFIVKSDSIWQLTGRTSSDWYLRCLVDKIGIESSPNYRAFECIGGSNLTLLSRGRLWSKSGDMTDVSDQVNGALVPARLGHLNWDTRDHRLYLTVPDNAGETGRMITFDSMRKAWYRWEIPATCTFCSPDDGRVHIGLLTGQFAYLNPTLQKDNLTGTPVNFTCTVQEQFIPIGAPLLEKYLRHVYVDGSCASGAGTLTLKIRPDSSTAETTVTKTGLTFPCVLNLPKYRFVELSVTVSVSDATGFTYKGVDVGHIPVRRKRT